MKGRMSRAVITAAVAVLLWPAVRANAACSNIADTTNPDCKAASKCQASIWKEAQNYIKTVQSAAATLMNNSLNGKNTSAQKYICMGGALDAKACVFNNGVCKGGTEVGKECSVNTDCAGTGATCNRATGFGCNGANNTDDDTVECQPDQRALNSQKAQATVRNNILKACGTTGTPDVIGILGLDNIAGCPKAGTSGFCSNNATLACTADTQCGAGHTCNPNPASQINALVDCIEKSAEGGTDVVDTNLRVFGKISGSGANPPQLKPNAAQPTKDLLPRQIWQLQGANTLEIGAGVVNNSDNGSAVGGSITAMALAHCTGGNNNLSCLNDVDCGTGGNCVRNTAGAGDNAVTGTKGVHSSPTSNSPAPNGNILTVTQTVNSLVGPVCLTTRTQDSGNGTAVSGTFNLTTGRQATHAPVLTNVAIGVACPVCKAGTCQNDLTGKKTCCDSGVNAQLPCTAPSGSVTQECPVLTPGADNVPNPFNLTTDALVMDATQAAASTCGFCDTDAVPNGVCDSPPCLSCVTGNTCPGSRTCDTTSGLSSKAFCGFCSGNSLVGCQTNAQCVTAGVGPTCNFANSPPGFFTDCSTTHLAVQGEANLYASKAVGLFCTGKTGNATVNAGQGLPGPVEVVTPYINGYVFTKDATP